MEIDYSLYLVTDRYLCGERNMLDVVMAAVQGGVTIVQLREKSLSTGRLIELAKQLKYYLDAHRIPLIINDNVAVAKEVSVGVHLGQQDMSYDNARQQLGVDKIIGVSVSNKEQLSAINSSGVDYIGIGPVFKTTTKLDAEPSLGCKELARICNNTSHKTVAIGGINCSNIRSVMAAGVDGVAIISALFNAKNIQQESQELLKVIQHEKI